MSTDPFHNVLGTIFLGRKKHVAQKVPATYKASLLKQKTHKCYLCEIDSAPSEEK